MSTLPKSSTSSHLSTSSTTRDCPLSAQTRSMARQAQKRRLEALMPSKGDATDRGGNGGGGGVEGAGGERKKILKPSSALAQPVGASKVGSRTPGKIKAGRGAFLDRIKGFQDDENMVPAEGEDGFDSFDNLINNNHTDNGAGSSTRENKNEEEFEDSDMVERPKKMIKRETHCNHQLKATPHRLTGNGTGTGTGAGGSTLPLPTTVGKKASGTVAGGGGVGVGKKRKSKSPKKTIRPGPTSSSSSSLNIQAPSTPPHLRALPALQTGSKPLLATPSKGSFTFTSIPGPAQTQTPHHPTKHLSLPPSHLNFTPGQKTTLLATPVGSKWQPITLGSAVKRVVLPTPGVGGGLREMLEESESEGSGDSGEEEDEMLLVPKSAMKPKSGASKKEKLRLKRSKTFRDSLGGESSGSGEGDSSIDELLLEGSPAKKIFAARNTMGTGRSLSTPVAGAMLGTGFGAEGGRRKLFEMEIREQRDGGGGGDADEDGMGMEVDSPPRKAVPSNHHRHSEDTSTSPTTTPPRTTTMNSPDLPRMDFTKPKPSSSSTSSSSESSGDSGRAAGSGSITNGGKRKRPASAMFGGGFTVKPISRNWGGGEEEGEHVDMDAGGSVAAREEGQKEETGAERSRQLAVPNALNLSSSGPVPSRAAGADDEGRVQKKRMLGSLPESMASAGTASRDQNEDVDMDARSAGKDVKEASAAVVPKALPTLSKLPTQARRPTSLALPGKTFVPAPPLSQAEPASSTTTGIRRPSYPSSLGSGPLAKPTARVVSNPVVSPGRKKSFFDDDENAHDTIDGLASNSIDGSAGHRSVSDPVKPGLSKVGHRLSLGTEGSIYNLNAALAKLQVKKDGSNLPVGSRASVAGANGEERKRMAGFAMPTASSVAKASAPPSTFTYREKGATAGSSSGMKRSESTAGNRRLSTMAAGTGAQKHRESQMSRSGTVGTSLQELIGSSAGSGCLKGVVAFVDVRTKEGDDSSVVFIDMLKQCGARVLAKPSESCTHIIYKSGKSSTISAYHKFDTKPFLVGIGWVTKCKEAGKRLDESIYEVNLEEIEVFQKRRKSMEPRQLQAMMAGNGLPSIKLTGPENSMSIAQARRRSMQFAPKISSPLKRAFRGSVPPSDDEMGF